MPKKKSNNVLRIQRLQQEMDELNYLNRVISEVLGPLRERKQRVTMGIREKLLDEGIPPDATRVQVDDETLEIEWFVDAPEKAPVPPQDTPEQSKPATAKKKPSAKKKARARK